MITLIRKASSRRFAWWQHEIRVLYVSIPGFTPACFIACTQGEVHKIVNEGKIRTIPAPSILSTSKLHYHFLHLNQSAKIKCGSLPSIANLIDAQSPFPLLLSPTNSDESEICSWTPLGTQSHYSNLPSSLYPAITPGFYCGQQGLATDAPYQSQNPLSQLNNPHKLAIEKLGLRLQIFWTPNQKWNNGAIGRG